MSVANSKVPSQLFSVTDHHNVLTLNVVDFEEHPSFIKVKTELAESEPSEFNVFHHKEYFEKIYLEVDGTSSKVNTFVDKEAAVSFAKDIIADEIERKERELAALKAKLLSHG
jgi:hypothetical protein